MMLTSTSVGFANKIHAMQSCNLLEYYFKIIGRYMWHVRPLDDTRKRLRCIT